MLYLKSQGQFQIIILSHDHRHKAEKIQYICNIFYNNKKQGIFKYEIVCCFAQLYVVNVQFGYYKLVVVDTFICITILYYYDREEHSSRVILVRSLCNDKSSLLPILFWVHFGSGDPAGTVTLIPTLSSGVQSLNISRVWVTGSSWGLPEGLRFQLSE